MEKRQLIIFLDKLKSIVSKRELAKLVLGNPRVPSSDLRSVIITIVEFKNGMRLNFIFRYKTKDITKNYAAEESFTVIQKALEEEFFNADLFATGETIQLTTARRGKVKIKTTRPVSQAPVSFMHDHIKERVIGTDNNIYLRELGVLNADFGIRREMADKYHQINRYIELISPALKELSLPEGFTVADMGSGKGYLTFALYDYLTARLGKNPVVTGVEAREELVSLCNEVAVKSGFANLHFRQGTIAGTPIEKIDILIALHACDTATDDAIFRGISAGASLIVCAPCCHKQVRKEMNTANEMKSILKHGILLERQAEILTDGLRALLMESQGYRTKIVEFVSTEHTPKNLLIIGQKIPGKQAAKGKIPGNILKIKEYYGIERLYLEELLAKPAF